MKPKYHIVQKVTVGCWQRGRVSAQTFAQMSVMTWHTLLLLVKTKFTQKWLHELAQCDGKSQKKTELGNLLFSLSGRNAWFYTGFTNVLKPLEWELTKFSSHYIRVFSCNPWLQEGCTGCWTFLQNVKFSVMSLILSLETGSYQLFVYIHIKSTY